LIKNDSKSLIFGKIKKKKKMIMTRLRGEKKNGVVLGSLASSSLLV
jgi:hypothetical protein